MGENRKPLSLKEGHIYIDGVEVMDAVKLTIVYTPVCKMECYKFSVWCFSEPCITDIPFFI